MRLEDGIDILIKGSELSVMKKSELALLILKCLHKS